VIAGRPDWDPGWKAAILGGMVPLGLRRARRRRIDPLTMARIFTHCDELLLAPGKTIRMTDAWRRAVTGPPEAGG
jgi:hypothetical protein